MKINALDDMLMEKAYYNQKKRKERISTFRRSKLKLKLQNKQKNMINKINYLIK